MYKITVDLLVMKLMEHSSDFTLLKHLYAFDIADPFLLYEVLLPLVPIWGYSVTELLPLLTLLLVCK